MDIAPDLKTLAERDEIIIRMMGKQPEDEYIEETYGVKLVVPINKPPDPNPKTKDFTEDGLDSPEQVLEQALDAIDAAIIGRGNYKTKKGSFPIPWGDIPALVHSSVSPHNKKIKSNKPSSTSSPNNGNKIPPHPA